MSAGLKALERQLAVRRGMLQRIEEEIKEIEADFVKLGGNPAEVEPRQLRSRSDD